MRNLIILFTFFVLLCICTFIASCDDFFSPTIEVIVNQYPEKDTEEKPDIVHVKE